MTQENCCCSDECCCESEKDKWALNSGDEVADMFAKSANNAWDSLMVDKMKILWEERMGKQMDKMAEASVELSMAFHGSEMKKKTDIQSAIEKLHESMKM